MNAVNDEQAIRDLIDTWMAATKAGAIDRVLGLMTDDVVFLTPGRPLMRGKADFAEALRTMGDAALDATSTVEEVHVTGDWAWAWTTLSIAVTPLAGATVHRKGTTLSIFRKRGGAWALHRDANLLVSQP